MTMTMTATVNVVNMRSQIVLEKTLVKAVRLSRCLGGNR